MKFRMQLSSTSSLVDLTPLVDVMFLLLIFFVITSDLLPIKAMEVESPVVNRQSEALSAELLVVMDAQHVIYFGSEGEIVDLQELRERLSGVEAQSAQLVLNVDHRAEYGAFLRLFSLAQDLGPRVKLVYQTAEG
jgi:biopolymer transport protein ExbD